MSLLIIRPVAENHRPDPKLRASVVSSAIRPADAVVAPTVIVVDASTAPHRQGQLFWPLIFVEHLYYGPLVTFVPIFPSVFSSPLSVWLRPPSPVPHKPAMIPR